MNRTAPRARPATPQLRVAATGPLATVQDGGRPGYGHLGVGRSGAVDGGALAAANRLVGNDPGAAAVEATLGGLRLITDAPAVVAVAGAPCDVRIDGIPAGNHCRLRIGAHTEIALGTPAAGLRAYLALRGGIRSLDRRGRVHTAELGSMATDTLTQLGPPPLEPDDVLGVGAPHGPLPAADLIPQGIVAPQQARAITLPVVWGPRDDWFTPWSRDALQHGLWTVSDSTDRVGARLRGETGLVRSGAGELTSEPMATGALQVPPDGQPVLFLADHPVTGGYPVIAVVRGRALDAAGQLRPGDQVRFAG